MSLEMTTTIIEILIRPSQLDAQMGLPILTLDMDQFLKFSLSRNSLLRRKRRMKKMKLNLLSVKQEDLVK